MPTVVNASFRSGQDRHIAREIPALSEFDTARLRGPGPTAPPYRCRAEPVGNGARWEVGRS